MALRRIEIEQDTSEWLELRQTKVCASDMAIILGESPYKSRDRLLMEKRGEMPPTPMNAAMSRGKEREPHIREWINQRFEQSFQPCVCLHHTHDCFLASLDGVNLLEDLILEIKTTRSKDVWHPCLLGFASRSYYIQVQTQLCCVDTIERAVFTVELQDGTDPPDRQPKHHIVIQRDKELIKRIEDEGLKFYEEMMK